MGSGTNKRSDIAGRAVEQRPMIGEPVWVQGHGFRVLAYRDRDGKWRNVGDQKEVVGVVRWLKPE